jgi:hypothetical protein
MVLALIAPRTCAHSFGLLVRAGLVIHARETRRMSFTRRPWYISYVSWFSYLFSYESEAVSLEWKKQESRNERWPDSDQQSECESRAS